MHALAVSGALYFLFTLFQRSMLYIILYRAINTSIFCTLKIVRCNITLTRLDGLGDLSRYSFSPFCRCHCMKLSIIYSSVKCTSCKRFMNSNHSNHCDFENVLHLFFCRVLKRSLLILLNVHKYLVSSDHLSSFEISTEVLFPEMHLNHMHSRIGAVSRM